MFQFLKSLFARGGPSVVLRVDQDGWTGRYAVLSHDAPAELLWLAAAGDTARTPRFAIAPAGRWDDPQRLQVSRSDYARVLAAYLQDQRVVVLVRGPGADDRDDFDNNRDYRTYDSGSSTASSTRAVEGQGGRFGGGGASSSWDDAPAQASSTAHDVAAAAALGALGVGVVSDIVGQQDSSAPEPPLADTSADTFGDNAADSGSDSGGYDR
ncbi:MAG: hypothetical protein P4L83_06905 [Nevskia sp.]|nr:hypothetical protein [Nevskia sp.]